MTLPGWMRFGKEVRAPILALFFISLGGLLLHMRIHPPGKEAFYVIPAVSGVVTTFVLPFMFNHARTVAWAYVITLAAVLIGTLTMAYHSVAHWPEAMPVTLANLILRTTLADILILAAKVPLAHMILRHFRPVQ